MQLNYFEGGNFFCRKPLSREYISVSHSFIMKNKRALIYTRGNRKQILLF